MPASDLTFMLELFQNPFSSARRQSFEPFDLKRYLSDVELLPTRSAYVHMERQFVRYLDLLVAGMQVQDFLESVAASHGSILDCEQYARVCFAEQNDRGKPVRPPYRVTPPG